MNFQKEIINWYSTHKRNLPWRQTRDPYFIWLSEIILQQTQVKQGLPYYKKFSEAYPSVFDLARASEEEVLKLWQGLGYYSRARNLHSTAKYVAFELDGIFPDSYKELIKLKGVGDYTASAIASFAYNEAKAVLDGNVFRVLSRYYGLAEPINSTKGLKLFKELSQSLIYKEDPGTYNQAIMEFGALQCKPALPDCSSCPLSSACIARKEDSVASLPVKLKKTKVKRKYFNFLIYLDPEGRTSLEQRKTKGIWQNLYQFPLIESEHSLQPEDFNKLISQTNFRADDLSDFFLFNDRDTIHKLSHRELHTKFWIVLLKRPLANGMPYENLKNFPVPVLIANFLDEFNFNKAEAQFF
jgi:A/G-specific adenine glycosylase